MRINKRLLIGLIIAFLLLGGLGLSIFLSQQQQDVRQRAAEPVPSCVSNQAKCTWDAVANATTYHYKIIDVSSNAVISEGDIPSSTTQIAFTSQANKTYKCIVSAVNTCGVGPEGQAIATCSISPTPTNTPVPLSTPTATPIPTPTATPAPTNTPIPTPTPTVPVPTSTGCPLPAQVTNVRITCPNCAP